MLWWGDTPVGDRKMTSLYMKAACSLAKENVFALRTVDLCQNQKPLTGLLHHQNLQRSFTNSLSSLTTRKQTYLENNVFSEGIVFTFYFSFCSRYFMKSTIFLWVPVTSNMWLLWGFLSWRRTHLRGFVISSLFCSLRGLARNLRFGAVHSSDTGLAPTNLHL